jgi:hypothetical protein
MITMVDGFLLGIIATSSFACGLFFLRFWRKTRDPLFLAFALAFLIEAFNRLPELLSSHPNQSSPWVYIVRSCAFLIIIAGILNKNRRAG